MLQLAVTLLLLALVAALFGFGGIASSFVGIAQILFFVFLVLFLIPRRHRWSLRGRPPV